MKPTAIVTGSSRGIGFGAAIALAQSGFDVALNGEINNEELDLAVKAVADLGVKAYKAPFDVADHSSHDRVLAEIEEALGPITTLVNNAGVGVLSRGDPLDVSEESWDRCMSVNAKSMFFLTQTFVKRLLSTERDPKLFYSIINVTSSNAVAVAEPRAEYAASKAAAAMVSKAWATRLGRESIAVYDVQPGLIETDLTAPVIDQYKERAAQGLTLFPRVGQPEEVGEVIVTLASGKLPYTTGQTISADGGLLVPRF